MSIEQTNLNNNQVTKKYKKILNDLLSISHNDSCIFSNVDNKKIFDIQKKFGDVFFEKAISNESFLIPLTITDDEYFISQILKSETKEEIEKIYENANENIDESIKSKFSKTNLEKLKEEIIKDIQIKKQKSSFEWKMILNQAKAMNEQNNLWPIHLGFIYITLKIDNKIVQAPLFLKEVNIKIKNSKVSILSVGDIKMNEKLSYFLESNGFLFDLDIDYSKMSIKYLFNEVKKSWSQSFNIPSTLKGFVPNFKPNEIKNETVQFWPGVSLGFFEPTGGHLRKVMVKILEENLLDKILEVEFDKNIYKKRLKESIEKKNFGFYKIVHSNISQDKAVISALNQNTIIWGPPGTGKSQTITNILTNILMFDKTALVVSQKRAALEVLKDRMNALDVFCLFLLNDKEMNKKNFYTPIKEYISYLENFNENVSEKMLEIISKDEKIKMKLLHSIMISEFAKENISLYSNYIKNNDYKEEQVKQILSLDEKLKFDFFELKKQKPNKFKKFIKTNNNIKVGFFSKEHKKLKNTIETLKSLQELNLDLDYFVQKKEQINLNTWNKLNYLNQFENIDKALINDDQNLKIMISKNIVSKIKAFDENMRTKYNEFALDVRSATLDPIIFVKKHIDIIKIIYPIVITTPETDLQSWKQREFDYALLDESSQIFLEKGLPILYLAKIKILAGDDQQMQPSRWFAAKSDNEENPFGGIESLLDYAIAKGVFTILLDKNYRSAYASLMTFNSQVFYRGELDVVDTNNDDKTFMPIEVINVNGKWEDSKNKEELNVVIEKVIENVNDFKKIIVLCFNASQQNALESLIIEKYPEIEKLMEEKRLLVRNIENIQGDEADLLIVSIAYDKDTKLHATYVAKPGGKNALNVATSRARQKMVIIKSIFGSEIQNPNNSEDIGVFKEWLNFLDLSEEGKKNYIYYKNEFINNQDHERKINHTNVTMDIDIIANNLIDAIKTDLQNNIYNFDENFECIINYSIGTIKIPYALIHKETKKFACGFYLDNFAYFKSYDEYIIDQDIEQFFKIKKYPIHRVSVLNWHHKKDQIIKEIKNKFENLGN